MSAAAPNMADRHFRAGSEYELVVFDRLAVEEQMLLAELREDAAFYGILRPREGSGRTIRAVDRDTALLWLGAQTPGRLPFFVWESEREMPLAERRVTQLVLDGVLEIELDGAYVSGARALDILPKRNAGAATGRLRALSHEALRYAEALDLENPDELASRLYSYGGVPLSPAWTRRLQNTEDVLAFLGVISGTPLHDCLTTRFTRAPDKDDVSWISWSKASRRTPGPGDPVYKMYVSPTPEDLPQTFCEVVDVLAEHDHLQFKVGGSALGLLRADKLVVYFENVESLQRAANALVSRLGSVSPQGVPFSAEIGLSGLLSWGMDPPRTARVLAWQGYDSWRLWVVRRLASAMIAAQHESASDVAPGRYAMERLHLDGVDVDGWVPPNGNWWLS